MALKANRPSDYKAHINDKPNKYASAKPSYRVNKRRELDTKNIRGSSSNNEVKRIKREQPENTSTKADDREERLPVGFSIKKREYSKVAQDDPLRKQKLKEVDREVRRKRRMSKPFGEISFAVLKIWSSFIPRTVPTAEKEKSIGKLLDLVTDDVIVVLVQRGSTSRVFQSVLKFGTESHHRRVFEALKPTLSDLVKNRYAYRVVLAMLRRTSAEHKGAIIRQLTLDARTLVSFPTAVRLLDEIYSKVGTLKQRSDLLLPFYGDEFLVFKDTRKQILMLDGILKESPDKKDAIRKSLNTTLIPLISKTEVSAILNSALSHRLLLDLFDLSPPEERSLLVVSLNTVILRFVHSLPGTLLSCKLIQAAGAKDRKVITKSMRRYAAKIAKLEYGHVVILQLLRLVDDIVLLRRNIIEDIQNNLLSLSEDRHGISICAALLGIQEPEFYQLQWVKEVIPEYFDDSAPRSSKKDPETRRKELLDVTLDSFVEFGLAQAKQLLTHSTLSANVLVHIVLQARDAENNDYKKLVKAITSAVLPEERDDAEGELVKRAFESKDYLRVAPNSNTKKCKLPLHHQANAVGALILLVKADTSFASKLYKCLKECAGEMAKHPIASWLLYELMMVPNIRERVGKHLKQKGILSQKESDLPPEATRSAFIKIKQELQGIFDT